MFAVNPLNCYDLLMPPVPIMMFLLNVSVDSVLMDVHQSLVVDGRLRMAHSNGVCAEDHTKGRKLLKATGVVRSDRTYQALVKTIVGVSARRSTSDVGQGQRYEEK